MWDSWFPFPEDEIESIENFKSGLVNKFSSHIICNKRTNSSYFLHKTTPNKNLFDPVKENLSAVIQLSDAASVKWWHHCDALVSKQ